MNTKAKKAAIGACIALFANMGMNSTFTIPFQLRDHLA